MRLAGTEAVSSPEFTNVVESADPFHCTTELEMKPLPFTCKVKAGPPAVTLGGLMEVIAGGRTVKVTGAEVTPPDLTVTEAVPELAIKLAGTEAVNSVSLTTVVERAELFHWTTEPAANPEPTTVKVKAGPPAGVVDGLMEEIAGGGRMVKVSVLEVRPPEDTVICAAPGFAIRSCKTGALNWP